MWHGTPALCIALLAGLTFAEQAGAAIQVSEPDGSGIEVLAEGREFSLYVKGNRWDMSGPEDIIAPLSGDLAQESFSNGIYRALTAEMASRPGSGLSDAKFYLTFQGYQNSMFSLASGQRYPIDTSVYDRLTIKIRHLSKTGLPLGNSHPVVVYFFKDESPRTEGFFGTTNSRNVVSDGDWHIVSWDLPRDTNPTTNWGWTDFQWVKGLRIDPTNQADVQVEVDWVRLSSSNSPLNQFDVAWTGGIPPFTISARKSGEPDAILASSVNSSPATVDLDMLPPGDYRIVVGDGRESGQSPALLSINEAPLVKLTLPDRLGDVDNNYAMVEGGNPWGPMDAGDVYQTSGMQSVRYDNPAGTLTAVTTSTDSRIILNTPVPIDTSKYRMLSFTLSVSGIGPNQPFAISRVLWGDSLDTSLNTSEDLIVREGLNTYVIGDMREVPLEGQLPGRWTGFPAWFRFDPHELAGNQSIRLDNIALAPLDTAAPLFDITWEDSDSDDNASIALYADSDRTPNNGNETLIASGLQEDSTTDRFSWNAPMDVIDGEYWIYAVASDGLNEVFSYSDGPISVGEGTPADIRIVEPDGTGDDVAAGDDFARSQLTNAWDMSDAGDIPLTRSSNIDSQVLSGGIYAGRSTSSDPGFFLLFPGPTAGHEGSNGALTPIDTARYRYLTFRVRFSGSDAANVQVFFPKTGSFAAGDVGRTRFISVPAGEWQVVTIDLAADSDPGSPFSWSAAGEVQGLRFDPSTRAGTTFEFDWFTLTADSRPENQYRVEWAASEADGSDLYLFAVDGGGTRIPLAERVNPADQVRLVDLGRLAVGRYMIEADVVPGPTITSPGAVNVTTAPVGSIPAEPSDKLFNLSTRADAGMGALLAGFIIDGDPGSSKCVVLRGRGQSMSLPDTLAKLEDPTLRLKQGLTTLDYSDDWESHPSAPIIRGLGMAPSDPSESALYQCLSPGRYLAVFQGKSGTSPGIGIVEVFDVDNGTPYLFNISTRARVGPGAQVMSGGFIINGDSPRRVLIRGRGPSVKVEDQLRDPLLILRQGPNVLQENDNWREASNWRDIEATGAAPEADADSAILVTLEPGAYTAQVRAADNLYGGIAIVEVIDLTQ